MSSSEEADSQPKRKLGRRAVLSLGLVACLVVEGVTFLSALKLGPGLSAFFSVGYAFLGGTIMAIGGLIALSTVEPDVLPRAKPHLGRKSLLWIGVGGLFVAIGASYALAVAVPPVWDMAWCAGKIHAVQSGWVEENGILDDCPAAFAKLR